MATVANRYWMLLLLLVGAAVCYTAGFIAGFWLLLIIGAILELAFWGELIRRKRRGDF